MTKEHTIGIVTEEQKATGIHNQLTKKYGVMVCCVKSEYHGGCRVFALCTPHQAKRMSDFLDGWLFAQQ